MFDGFRAIFVEAMQCGCIGVNRVSLCLLSAVDSSPANRVVFLSFPSIVLARVGFVYL